MEKSSFTPGPWKVVAADDYEVHSAATPEDFPHRFKDDDLGRFVAQIGNRASDFGSADATLIAAAPELVEALKAAKELAATMASMTACRSDDEWVWGIQAKIDAALSKAGVS